MEISCLPPPSRWCGMRTHSKNCLCILLVTLGALSLSSEPPDLPPGCCRLEMAWKPHVPPQVEQLWYGDPGHPDRVQAEEMKGWEQQAGVTQSLGTYQTAAGWCSLQKEKIERVGRGENQRGQRGGVRGKRWSWSRGVRTPVGLRML